MAKYLDKAGRPIVVVTGMGIVTALGAGKADNWSNLVAGKSGIREITRFSTDGLKTRVAGAVDFVKTEEMCSPALAERLAEIATEEAIAEAGLGSPGSFPGPLFLAVAPVEIEWPYRSKLAEAAGSPDSVTYNDLLRAASTGGFKRYHRRFSFGSVGYYVAEKFGTQGSPISFENPSGLKPGVDITAAIRCSASKVPVLSFCAHRLSFLGSHNRAREQKNSAQN